MNRLISETGPKPEVTAPAPHIRCTLTSRHRQTTPTGPFGANNRSRHQGPALRVLSRCPPKRCSLSLWRDEHRIFRRGVDRDGLPKVRFRLSNGHENRASNVMECWCPLFPLFLSSGTVPRRSNLIRQQTPRVPISLNDHTSTARRTTGNPCFGATIGCERH